MTKKTKIIIGSASFATVLLIIVIGLIVGYSVQRNTLNLIYTKDINIELDNQAHTVSTYDFIGNENKDKLNAQFDNRSTSTEVMADSVYTADKNITVKYMNGALCKTQISVKINVIDTTPPEFTEKVDSITINKGEEIDIASKFKATDLSGKVKITVVGNVDVNTVGEQVVNVYATDDSGNVAQAEVTVIVNEVEKQNTENAEPTVNTNNTTTTKSNNSTSATKNNTSSSASTKNNSQSTTRGNSTNKNNSSSSKNNNSSTTNNSSSNTTAKNNTSSGTNTTTQKNTCTNNNKHSMSCGNMGRWFNSRDEVSSYYLSEVDKWVTKYKNNEITWEEKGKKCPIGYESWSCSYCGKWTGNFKYRQ